MSNTYFKITKEVKYPDIDRSLFKSKGYKNEYELTLTAFCGNEDMGNVQLTVQTNSTISGQSGTAYITLNDKEIDLLIAGLIERKIGRISATGDEQSVFLPAD